MTRLELKWITKHSDELTEMIYKSVVRAPMVLEAQTPENRERINDAIRTGAEALRTENGIELAFPAMMTVATKP